MPANVDEWQSWLGLLSDLLQTLRLKTAYLWSGLEDWLGQVPWLSIADGLSGFIFYYPLAMAYVWMLGAILYYFLWERRDGATVDNLPELGEYPPVSILIPCHNEAGNIRETIEYLLRQRYPDFEIVAINDGSRDNTLAILQRLADQYPQLRVVHLDTNQGKAMAL
ncbi:MAG: glycosyltransferase, partial [Methylococcaceae bacterium]|nr:glycosyltransferase [Methylococcaceae bacterium]